MRRFLAVTIIQIVLLIESSGAEPAKVLSRDEFLTSLAGGFVTEFGSFGTSTGDEAAFKAYICSNWDDLLKNLDTIPPPKKNKNLLIAIIGVAAEDLPPEEYINFLERYLDLAEANKIPKNQLSMQLGGRAKKNYFLSVNWKHPRVAAIFQRALKLFPDPGEPNHEALLQEASGKLADNYRTGKSVDTPNPETLSGIELRPPDESFFERLKKTRSRDEISTQQRAPQAVRNTLSTATGDASPFGSSRLPWVIAGALLLALIAFAQLIRTKLRQR